MYLRTVTHNPFIPGRFQPIHNSRQRQFLLLTDINEVFYGGAAGGGKSFSILLAAAQFLHVPGYSALLLRENFSDLRQPNSWIPKSKEMWMNREDCSWSAAENRWTFENGATITFGYLERDDDVYQYDTAEFQFIGIDELTQHTEWRYKFMFGRRRRPPTGPLSTVPLRTRSGSNPGNKGHDWVKKRFIDEKTREKGAVFVPAKLDDNAGNLDVESYRRDSLSQLDPITRAQREHGDWNAIAGGRYKKEWFRYYTRNGGYCVLQRPDKGPLPFLVKERPIFFTVDTAASVKKAADWTVISVWCVSPESDLVWLACIRGKWEVPDIVPEIQKAVLLFRPGFVGIEAVAANNAVLQLAQRASNPAIPARKLDPGGQDKLVLATPAINFTATGRLYLPCDSPTFPLDDVVSELVLFTGNDKEDAHDDIVDTLSQAVRCMMNGTGGKGGRPMVLGGNG